MRCLVALAAAALAAACVPAALAGPSLHVGAAEDAAIWNDPGTEMDLARLAGFDTVRLTVQWSQNSTTPVDALVQRIQEATFAATQRGLQPIVSIYNVGSSSTPADDVSRSEFVNFARNVVANLPWVSTFIVGNEPNSGVYWLPQFDANGFDVAAYAYEALLAQTYDAIKSIRPDATVVGGALDPRGGDDPASSRQSHSPTAFITDLGAAYRASGRAKPIMDVFDEHVYADNSSLPPSMPHASSSTLAEGDYAKLVALLGKAFDGTAQRGSTLPILYGEFGVETVVPPAKAGAYSGTEPASSGAVDEATQARYYTEAFKLALCQPNVIGVLVFHVVDESALGAWQSGVYYADGTPKSSLPAVRDAAVAARAGTLTSCPDRTPPAVSLAPPAADGTVTATAADDVGVAKVALAENGVVVGVKFAPPYTFAVKAPAGGRATLEARAYDAAGNVGRATVAIGSATSLRQLLGRSGSVADTIAGKAVWFAWCASRSAFATFQAGVPNLITVYNGARAVALGRTRVVFAARSGVTYRIAVSGPAGPLSLSWRS